MTKVSLWSHFPAEGKLALFETPPPWHATLLCIQHSPRADILHRVAIVYKYALVLV